MSERAKLAAARARGRKDFWAGVLVDSNPMRARDSRAAWADAWRHEEAESRTGDRILAEQRKRRTNTTETP